MATGEGKTLVATLPVFLNALTGNGVHVVTVNDYLAKRDSEWMGPLYMFHGLSVDCIDKHQPNSDARRQAYLADITFGTNNEFGFDYLRDNMAISPKDLVQRQHNYAIVDEVDSVLIDDARTPLIISGPVPKGDDQLFEQLRPQVERLVEAQKKLATQYLADAKRLIASNDKKEQEEGFLALYRSHKCLPQIRLIQNNDTVMVEKIQTTIVNTIPLWKSQMVLALGIAHSAEAAQAQRQVTDITNELLRKNAETLHMATVETAKESERGIVDLETLQKTNADLIQTLDDVMRIQMEGRQKRQ